MTAFAACDHEGRILVVVDSDLSIPSDLRTVRATVVSSRGEQVRDFDVRGREGDEGYARSELLPLSFVIEPAGGDSSGDVEIVVEAHDSTPPSDASKVVDREARTGFIAGRTLVLPMPLMAACRPVVCGEGQTCVDGACVNAYVDPETLDTVTDPGDELGGSDPCRGLVQDLIERPPSALAKPDHLVAVVDPELGGTFRRITEARAGGAIVPLHPTVPAWNADESRLILYEEGTGHRLHDGRTYAFIGPLDIDPADLEQVYWDPRDPDLFYYVDGNDFVRYVVSAATAETLETFSFCEPETASAAGDPAFMAWERRVIGLRCGGRIFAYDIDADRVSANVTDGGDRAPAAAPSGSSFVLGSDVLDGNLALLRTLDRANDENSTLARLASGADVLLTVAFEPGVASDVGTLVLFELDTGASRVIIGPETGYPYPPGDTQISATALARPGWVALSVVADSTQGEVVVVDANSGRVCRAAHHRSTGEGWAAVNLSISPTASRVAFASDWEASGSVDTYVLELPAYR